MALNPTTGTDNPQVPSVTAELYVPDQLIAGRFPPVTGQAIILTGGAALSRGTVLGQITAGAVTAAAKVGGNTGNGTCTVLSAGAKAKPGPYTLAFTDATHFTVVDPDGEQLADGVNGAYSDAEINFTITAGGAAFVAGDGFVITVAAGSGKYKECVATAIDGSQVPAAILGDYTDASAGDVNCAAYLTGEFNGAALTLDASWSLATITPKLRAINCYVRTAVPSDVPTNDT